MKLLHTRWESEPFDRKNLFVCFLKRKALADLLPLSDLRRLELDFLKAYVDEIKSLCRREFV